MKKVLLINPSRDSLVTYRTILGRDDLKIFTATTAEEGLMIHRREKADLLLLELDLPDMGGDELCARIREEHELRKVSVIIICRDLPDEIVRADNCGANARLVRPFKLAQLDECVGKLLAVRARQDCRVLVKVQVSGERGAGTLIGTTRNISLTGLMIESDELLSVGDRISCTFLLPDANRITTTGEVIRATRKARMLNQYGIRFISLDPESRAAIECFIAADAPAG